MLRPNRLPLLVALLVTYWGCAELHTASQPEQGRVSSRSIDLYADERVLRQELTRLAALREIVEEYEREQWQRFLARSRGELVPAQGVEEIVIAGASASAFTLAAPSVTAFDSGHLEALGAEDVSALADFTPNLEIGGESITNNQEQGVDEGDIVKRRGDFLIVLRRGRLFSFDVGRSPGTPIAKVDESAVFPLDAEHEAWYDELLINGDTVIVVGYGEGFVEGEDGGFFSTTEIALFRLDGAGHLEYQRTYLVRSYDYYSWRNYATRLIGDALVLYVPLDLDGDGDEPLWPRYLTVDANGSIEPWRALIRERQIHRAPQHTLYPILHAVVRCRIGGSELDCDAHGIVGPGARVFYVSRSALYLWLSGGGWILDEEDLVPEAFRELVHSGAYEHWQEGDSAILYRVPLGGGAITGVRMRGRPLDQFSFRERREKLEIMLYDDWWRDDGRRREWAEVPLDRFIARPELLPVTAYQELPAAGSDCLVNRFVGEYLLYGSCTEGDDRRFRGIIAQRVDRREEPADRIPLGHPVTRIEPVGLDALVVGEHWEETRIELHFTPVLLDERPQVARTRSIELATELESRSHAFNYTRADGGWLLGLPMARLDRLDRRLLWRVRDPGLHRGIQYFGMDADGSLTSIGWLEQSQFLGDDDCQTSCVDWYGSMRPIFMDGRVLALMDYELVEAEISRGRLREIQRVSALAP